jgi:hypothetical protein
VGTVVWEHPNYNIKAWQYGQSPLQAQARSKILSFGRAKVLIYV